MKKVILYAALAALPLMAVSCRKDNTSNNDGLMFTASIDGGMDTKTQLLSGRKVRWVDGDMITINAVPYKATLDSLQVFYPNVFDPTKATFTKLFGTTPTGTFYAFYPDGIQSDATAGGTLPQIQTYSAGRFSNIPMFAQGTTTDLSFKNICAVLAVTVKSADYPSVWRIRVSSGNCAMRGAFTVQDGQTAVLKNPTAVNNSVILDCVHAIATTADGTVFYIAIPAQTYRNLKIELSADGGTYTRSMTTKKDADIAVAVNTIYPITFKGEPTTGTAKATINGENVDVGWVQLWAGGPKFAVRNVGADDATSFGSLLSGDQAAETGSNYVWGSNWRTPSKDEIEGFTDASKVSSKISYTHQGLNSCILTGVQAGYTGNSISFPLDTNTDDPFFSSRYYWSSSDSDGPQWYFSFFFTGYNLSALNWGQNYSGYYVRPVLNE